MYKLSSKPVSLSKPVKGTDNNKKAFYGVNLLSLFWKLNHFIIVHFFPLALELEWSIWLTKKYFESLRQNIFIEVAPSANPIMKFWSKFTHFFC